MSENILIADDSVNMRVILKDILHRSGYTVVGEAGDGAEAVSMFDKLVTDAALIDLAMPKMDGLEALKAIKSAHADAKVVMICALGQQELVIDALRAGASDFIIKPFQAERVLEALKKTLK